MFWQVLVATPLPTAAQVIPDPPQFFGSEAWETQLCPAAPDVSVYPLEQVRTQALFWQVLEATPLPTAGHFLPAPPQLLGSEACETQVRDPSVAGLYPEEHVITHLLLLQVLVATPLPVAGHAFPKDPQLHKKKRGIRKTIL